MKRRGVTVSLVLLAMASLLVACGGEPIGKVDEPDADPVELRITEKMSGASTGMEVGHWLKVELESNATTGFEWKLLDVDATVLRSDGQEYIPPEDEALGAPGLAIWRFEAVGKGTTTIKLGYQKAFEEDAPPEKTFTLTVAVGGS